MNLIVDGLDVTVKDEGSGPVVLMLHGWKSDLTTFDGLAEKLKDNYRVIRPNLPGFGGSQIPATDWGVADYANFVRSYLDKMKASEVAVIIGHSMGGRIAMYGLANGVFTSPRLIMLGAAGIPQSSTPRSLMFKGLAKVGKAVSVILPRTIQEKLRRRLYAAANATDYLSSAEMKQIFLNIAGEDARAYASKIKSQTLLIYGKDDTQTPVRFGQAFNHLIPKSDLEVVPSAGHYVHHDQQQLVERKIQEFLG